MKSMIAVAALLAVLGTSCPEDTPPKTEMDALLATRMSFRIERESLDAAARQLTKKVRDTFETEPSRDFEIRILAGDLKIEGLTRNQRISDLELDDKPLSAVLTLLVQKANGNVNSKAPSSPDQRIVWVVGPEPYNDEPDNDDRRVILVTTRQGAAAKSLRLPKVFQSPKPTP